ncbi:MAG: DUF2752 domain-containing protein [Actinomycetota bacterium]|nr:DUF2752 domain-containing protein [Actinomycetota bacterium]
MPTFTDEDVVEQERVDTRPRRRRMAGPLLALGGSALALGYLAAVDPNEPGHYPLCPTRALFGVDCPGCGLLRGTHDLVTGNVGGALDHNVLILAAVPVLVVLWIRWVMRAWRGSTPPVTYEQFRRRNAILVVSLVAVLAFGVVRNFVPYLGSGIG